MGSFDFVSLYPSMFSCSERKFIRTIDDTSRTKVYTMDIPGIDADKVTITKNWVNRTKSLTLNVLIDKGDDEFYEESIYINTNLYNKYSYEVKNGRITITLYEIINPEPEFELI